MTTAPATYAEGHARGRRDYEEGCDPSAFSETTAFGRGYWAGYAEAIAAWDRRRAS